LAERLPRAERIVATDLNEGMIAVSKRAVAAPNVTWQQADALRLPFADGEFDAVVCQFGMMFLPDKVAGGREARRVLARGGRFVFSVWGRLEDNEVSEIVARAVAAMFPADPPRFYERIPFGFADHDRLRREAEEAGFARVAVETVDTVTYGPSAEIVAMGLCEGTPLRGEIEARGGSLADATARAAEALTARFGSEKIENQMRALVVTGFNP
jgi:ubiquinone/menaquinone biosynthesis C-methylase UbiE